MRILLILILILISSCQNCPDCKPRFVTLEIDSEIVFSTPENDFEKHEMKDKPDKLILAINENLMNKININLFLDSLTKQNNVKLIEILEEEFDPLLEKYSYKSKNYEFSLIIELKNEQTNTIFYDGKYKIDFSKHKPLTMDNNEYQSETFGFNNSNRLYDAKVIEIAGQRFLYSGVSHKCNGLGCGVIINFIYDLTNHKGFFVENFRFPFEKFMISDFNNDSIVDLLVIGRNRSNVNQLKGIPLNLHAYQATWFEFVDKNFVRRKGLASNESYSFEFISYSLHGMHSDTDYSLILNQ